MKGQNCHETVGAFIPSLIIKFNVSLLNFFLYYCFFWAGENKGVGESAALKVNQPEIMIYGKGSRADVSPLSTIATVSLP